MHVALQSIEGTPRVSDHGVIMLDGGSNVNIVRDIELLQPETIKNARGHIVGASQTALQPSRMGIMSGIFHKLSAWFDPKATANIIAECEARDNYTLKFTDEPTVSVIMYDKDTKETATFKQGCERLKVRAGNVADKKNNKEKYVSYATRWTAFGLSKNDVERAMRVDVLHRHLSYPGRAAMKRLTDHHAIRDMNFETTDLNNYFDYIHDTMCNGCILGKRKQAPAKALDIPRGEDIGTLVHGDIIYLSYGKVIAKKKRGRKFIMFLLLTDDKSSFTIIEYIKKRDTVSIMEAIQHARDIYKAHGHTINKLRLDSESGFRALGDMLRKEEPPIGLEIATPGRHERVAEAKTRTLKACVRATINGMEYELPEFLYTDVINWCIGSINYTILEYGTQKTPYEMFFNRTWNKDDGHRQFFGQLVVCYQQRKSNTTDVDPRGKICIVTGRSADSKGSVTATDIFNGVKLDHHDATEIALSPFYMRAISELGEKYKSVSWYNMSNDDDNKLKEIIEKETNNNDNRSSDIMDDTEDDNRADNSDNLIKSTSNSSAAGPSTDAEENDDEEDMIIIDAEAEDNEDTVNNYIRDGEEMGNSVHKDSPVNEDIAALEKYITSTAEEEEVEGDDSGNEELDCDEKDVASATSTHTHGTDEKGGEVAIANEKEAMTPFTRKRISQRPKTAVRRSERIRIPKWNYSMNLNIQRATKQFGAIETNKAILAEISQLDERAAWNYVEIGEDIRGGNVIPSNLFLKEKLDAKNKFEKIKARLVGCGNFQDILECLGKSNCNESPTVNMHIVFLILSISAKKGLIKKVFDVAGAYLNAKLEPNEYQLMRLNKDIAKVICDRNDNKKRYMRKDGSIIVRLTKALYGLRVSARKWYALLVSKLVEIEFEISMIDKCLLYKKTTNGVIYVLIFVDDLLVCGDHDDDVTMVYDKLRTEFGTVTVKEGGEISFLGMMIKTNPDNGNITVQQPGYTEDIIKQYEIIEVRDSPYHQSFSKIEEGDNLKDTDATEYKSLIMKLMYLAVRTRPDILYAVVALASKGIKPSVKDMVCAKHVIEYLNKSTERGLIYHSDGDMDVNCYVDASFNCHPDARSHSGYVIFPDHNKSAGILFKSAKQKTVADSSTEAELIALHEAMKHLIWIISIYEELGYVRKKPAIVYQDNQACIKLSSTTPVNFKGRSKYINRKYFSVHEYVENDTIRLVYCGTDDQVADYLTKALSGSKEKKFRVHLMGYN